MLIGSRPISNWLQISGGDALSSTGTESNPYNLIAGFICLGFASYVIAKRKVDLAVIIQKNIFLFVLLVYCLVSCVWSDDPFVSFRRYVNMIVNIFVVIAILSEPDRISAIKKFFGRVAIFALPLSIVLIKYFPSIATDWNKTGEGMMWTGVCTHKNTLGSVLAVCILLYVWKWFILNDLKTIKADVLLCLLAAYLMFSPEVKGSSSAQQSLFVSLGILFSIKFFKNYIQKFMTIFYVLICLYFVADFSIQMVYNKNILQMVALASGRDLSFTGRTYIWDAVLEEAAQSPIVGTGYGMFWTGERLKRLIANPYVGDDIKQAHNGFVETYANLGIIGVVLLIITLFTSLNKRLKEIASNYEFNSLAIAFIVQYILAEFFEATALTASPNRWVFLLLFIISVPPNVSLTPAELVNKKN